MRKRTQKQIEASRANGARSKGPITPEGKVRSAANSIQHGGYATRTLLPGESEEYFKQFAESMLQQWRPATPVEALLVEQMTICLWRIRRCAPAEAAILTMRMRQMAPAVDAMFGPEVSAPGRLALAFEALSQDGDTPSRLARQERRHWIQYQALREELEHIQANRPNDDGPGDAPQETEKPAGTNPTASQPQSAQPPEAAQVTPQAAAQLPAESSLCDPDR